MCHYSPDLTIYERAVYDEMLQEGKMEDGFPKFDYWPEFATRLNLQLKRGHYLSV